jgi:subtilisin family serine protease
MLGVFVTVAAACAACAIDEVASIGSRWTNPHEPLVNQQVEDGCTRFALRVVNGVASVEALYNTNGCQSDALQLEADSAPVFNATTGVLRVPVVLRNLGATPVVAPARIRFNADSAQFLDAQGQVIAGSPNILATNYDTANANGRTGQWRYDAALAATGQPQVLMPNAVSQRRWLEFSGSDWSQRVRIKLPTMATVAPTVPAVAPDSTPKGWISAASIVTPSAGFPYVRGYVLVGFKVGTSVAERGRVVALLRGTVAGGYLDPRSEGGLYLLRLPPDSTDLTLLQAEAQLRQEGAVRFFTRVVVPRIDPTYRRPVDGVVYNSSPWRLTSTGILSPAPFQNTWAMEYVRAPLAWGCAVGDSSVHVGVVDQGIRTSGVTDLPSVVRFARRTNLVGDTVRHGTRVLSVLAARGDNQLGIAGMSWQSSVSLFDATEVDSSGRPALDSTFRRIMPQAGVAHSIYLATQQGAKIVNISLGANLSPTVNLNDPVQFADAERLMGQTAGMLSSGTGGTVAPLLVVSSGNVPQADPRTSLFPFLKDSLPASTIVVAAMRRDSTPLSAPTGSSYIDVVAPGENVAVWDDKGIGIHLESGASFATPIVSGVAALLLAVDPTLSADSLKYYVVRGAVESGRTVSGYPVVDAYRSLRLLANRATSPLCGNRLWVSNRAIHVERGTTVETLPITLPSDSVWNLEVAHGGKRINYETQPVGGFQSLGSVVWTPNGWISGPSTEIPTADRGGSNRSVQLVSHNGDSLIRVLVAQSTTSVDVDVSLWADAGLTPLRSTMISLPGLAAPPAINWPENEWVYVSGAYPQNGGDAVVAVNRIAATNTTWLSECPNGPSVSCTPGAVFYRYHWLPKRTDLYRVNVSSAPMTATHIATIPDTLVYDVAFSEDGREKLLRMGRDSIYDDPQAGVYNTHVFSCRQSWSRPTFGSSATNTPFDSTHARRQQDVAGCLADLRVWDRRGVGTSAPRVGPIRAVAPRSH